MPLLSAELFVDVLLHAYDAQKAREYYLRTRKLKGRKKGQQDVPTGRNPGHKTLTAAQKRAAAKAKAARMHKERKAKVDALNKRLERLKKILAKLTKQAKLRSGVKTPVHKTPAQKAKAAAAAKKAKPLTAAQKAAKAKAAAKAAAKAKERDPSLTVQAKEIEAKIKKVEAQIKAMKKKLAEAQSKAHANSKKKTASNGR